MAGAAPASFVPLDAPSSFEPAPASFELAPPDLKTPEGRKQHFLNLQKQIAEDQQTYGSPASDNPVQGFAEGVGQGMMTIGRGLGQMAGLVSPEEAAQASDTDTALLATPQGFIGNMMGTTAALAPVAGPLGDLAEAGGAALAAKVAPGVAGKAGLIASTAARGSATGAAQGALAGATTPVEPGQSRTANVVGGAAAGGLVGPLVPALLAKAQADRLAKNAAATALAVKDGVATRMLQAGMKLNPLEVRGDSVGVQAATGVAGKILVRHKAVAANQTAANQIARDALPDFGNQPLSDEAVHEYIQNTVGKFYEPLRSLGDVSTVGPGYSLRDTIANVGGKLQALAQNYSSYAQAFRPVARLMRELGARESVTADELLTIISDQRAQAFDSLTAARTSDKAKGVSLSYEAGARLGLADALEKFLGDAATEKTINARVRLDQIQQFTRTTGVEPDPQLYAQLQRESTQWVDAVGRYQEGRQRIARATDVRMSLEGSSDVNTHVLGRLARKGKPLSNGLDLLADAANEFPLSTMPLRRIGGAQALSMVDTVSGLAGAVYAAMHGGGITGTTGMFLASAAVRPATRAAVMSNIVQKRLIPRPVSLPGVLTERAIPRASQAVNEQAARAGISVMGQ